MFGFNILVLNIINIIEMNKVGILNGVVRIICLVMINKLLIKIVFFEFKIWLEI